MKPLHGQLYARLADGSYGPVGRVYPAGQPLRALTAWENARHNAANIVFTYDDGSRIRPFRFGDIDYDISEHDPEAERERRRNNKRRGFQAGAWLSFWKRVEDKA